MAFLTEQDKQLNKKKYAWYNQVYRFLSKRNFTDVQRNLIKMIDKMIKQEIVFDYENFYDERGDRIVSISLSFYWSLILISNFN